MGCVLQPGDVNSASALQPGQTTSDAVQPGQDIDDCFVAPLEVVQINNVTRFFSTADPSANDAGLFFELQNNGFAVIVEQPDTGAGPPNFFNVNVPTDWVIPRPAIGTYHARWNQTGGDIGPDGSSTAENVWTDLSGGFIFGFFINGVQQRQLVGTVDISDDGGLSTLDTAVIDLTLDLF